MCFIASLVTTIMLGNNLDPSSTVGDHKVDHVPFLLGHPPQLHQQSGPEFLLIVNAFRDPPRITIVLVINYS